MRPRALLCLLVEALPIIEPNLDRVSQREQKVAFKIHLCVRGVAPANSHLLQRNSRFLDQEQNFHIKSPSSGVSREKIAVGRLFGEAFKPIGKIAGFNLED